MTSMAPWWWTSANQQILVSLYREPGLDCTHGSGASGSGGEAEGRGCWSQEGGCEELVGPLGEAGQAGLVPEA